jgi:phosphatidate phosphatase APP1
LVRNTFCRPFQPVPGMAALYQSWTLSHGAAFHYVSASPWQLYLPLAALVCSNGFPAGTFHLKQFRVKDDTFFDLFQSPETFKLGAIEPLLARFPRRQFVLVGDSGEQDPEIYADLARRHPAQIRRIHIRDVTGEPADAARYLETFRGLPPALWRVCSQPGDFPPLP